MVDMLDAAESTLRECAKRFSLPMRFVRKDRAVGALYVGQPNRKTSLYLDELALEVRVHYACLVMRSTFRFHSPFPLYV